VGGFSLDLQKASCFQASAMQKQLCDRVLEQRAGCHWFILKIPEYHLSISPPADTPSTSNPTPKPYTRLSKFRIPNPNPQNPHPTFQTPNPNLKPQSLNLTPGRIHGVCGKPQNPYPTPQIPNHEALTVNNRWHTWRSRQARAQNT